jgi:eukaryotic-like serine/threonine-protein kinase
VPAVLTDIMATAFQSPARRSRAGVPALSHEQSSFFQPPDAVGPYRVRRTLASGVLGPVLAVEDGSDGDLLALKLIETESPADAEALAAALHPLTNPSLDHAGLLPLLATGADPLGAYVVMPLLDVPTLEARLRGGRQTVAVVLEWLGPVATGLQHAHANGVLHGALHPRDVLIPRSHAVLSGVGVVQALEACGLQAPVRIPFTAPERAAGDTWDAAADQYSLAMLALDALSGRRLVAGTIPAFDRWTLAETPAEDARLHEVFDRALHPDPDRRFASLADWLDALAGAAGATSELSRFTRDGVIPAAVAPLAVEIEAGDAGSEPLDLFAPEHAAVDDVDAASGDDPAAADATPRDSVRDREWLVATLPDDPPFDPAQSFEGARGGDTLYAPVDDIADVETAREDGLDVRSGSVVLGADEVRDSESDLPARQPDPAADVGDLPLDVARPAPTDRPPDDRTDGDVGDEAAESWGIDEPLEDEGGRRPFIVLALVALAVLAVGYGTWRSLSGGAEHTRAPVATSADRSNLEPPPEPTAVTEEAIVPSREDLEPGVAVDVGRDGTVSPRGNAASDPSAAAQTPGRVEPSAVPPAAPAAPAVAAPGRAAASPGTSAAGGREPPASAEGRGRVLIRASPAGDVRVNGTDYGTTPVVLRDLALGSYVVTITRPGFQTVVREINLLASQPVASIAVDLERVTASGTAPGTSRSSETPAQTPGPPPPSAPGAGPAARTGSLLVVSRPTGARVTIDGRDYGTTPVAVPGLPEGRHVIRLELPGYRPWEGMGQVQPGQRSRVEAALVQGPR